ncbi:MAG: LamG domain-containing protein [Planctomycetota bacterium]|jgi:hypothetical protein
MTRQIVFLSLAAAFLTSNSTVLATDRLVPSQYPTLEVLPISLNYDAEAYAYAHVGNPSNDSETKQDFSSIEKAQVQASAEAFEAILCSPQMNFYTYGQNSDTRVSVEGIYDPNGARLVSTLQGWGSWSWYDDCSDSGGSGTGGGDGNGYTSMAGTFTIGIFGGYPQASHGLTLRVDAEIFGDAPGSWGNWDWWLKIWDDDPNNPLALLSDINMSVNLDVLEGQVLNFEFYNEASKGSWPGAGLESTVLIDLYLLPFADLDKDYDIDFFDYAWFAMGYGTSNQIPKGSVVVDGNLGDWPEGVEWRELDKVYYANPDDVSKARFALQWDDVTDKVYAIVVINDTSHVFLDEYVYWDRSDRLEIYSQGDAAGGSDWLRTYDVAQQYYVAPNSTGDGWATWAYGETIAEDAGLEYAVRVEGDQIIYEVGVLMFDNYGGITGQETVITNLSRGHVVGFDLVNCTRWAPDGFGMLSENMMTGKSGDADQFARYMLVDEIFSVDLDGNGVVNYADLGILFENWLDCFIIKAINPNPTNNAISVDPDVTLSWWPGGGALYHDVYLGTDADAVANAGHLSPEFMGTVSEAHFDPCGLDWATMYYWRIDEIGSGCMIQGEVWKFKTRIVLISLWKFDEGSGTTAYDSAGTNDGTINGAQWATGRFGGALNFDGYNDYVDMADTVKGHLGTNYTVLVWIKADTLFSNKAISAYRHSIDGNPVLFQIGHGYADVGFVVRDNSLNIATATYTNVLTTNAWYHIAGTREENDVNIYVNGVSGMPGSGTIGAISSDNLKIGALRFGGNPISNHFDGVIDDVHIYNRALTAGEIWELYQEGLD